MSEDEKTAEPQWGAVPADDGPHIQAVRYARAYCVPLYRNNEVGTPYERGLIRSVAQHWLAGYFSARDSFQPPSLDAVDPVPGVVAEVRRAPEDSSSSEETGIDEQAGKLKYRFPTAAPHPARTEEP